MRSSFFFSSRRRHTRFDCDWSSDVCSSDLPSATLTTGVGRLVAGLLAIGRRGAGGRRGRLPQPGADRKSTRLNSSHSQISYAVFCLKKKKKRQRPSLASERTRSIASSAQTI